MERCGGVLAATIALGFISGDESGMASWKGHRANRQRTSRGSRSRQDFGGTALLRVLWRRRMAVAIVTLGSLLAAGAFALVYVPTYAAEAVVAFEGDDAAAGETAGSGQLPQRLDTRQLTALLIERVDVTGSSELNPLLREPSWTTRLMDAAAQWIPADWMSISEARAGNQRLGPGGEPDMTAYLREAIAGEVRERLSMSPIGGAGAVEIRFMSADPKLAADVANGLAELIVGEAGPGGRVVSAARTPVGPVGPSRVTIVALSLAGGLILGSIGAVGLERLDTTVRTGDQLSGLCGLQPLGMVPAPDEKRPTPFQLAAYVIDQPRSRFGEAVHNLVAATLAAAGDSANLVLLITSATEGEGKSIAAIAMAQLSAQMGIHTLLVDADLRKPQLRAQLGMEEGPGLGDVLRGRPVGPAEILRTDERSGLDVLAAGDAGDEPAKLMSSTAMRRLLAGLRLRYELIVIDAPAMAGDSYTRTLAPLADLTLLAVRWGSTPTSDVAAALRTLREIGARVAGGALTCVDLDRHAAYKDTAFAPY